MSLRTFQRALVELTLAPRKARLLRAGDLSVLAGFELTARERERICNIVHQHGISVSCTLSRGNRLEVIFQAFPMTCVILKGMLRELLDELWEESRPTNYQLAGEETAFARIIKRKIATSELSIEYLQEVFAYELACMELIRHVQCQKDPDAEVEAVVEFQHSPDELLSPLSKLMPPPAGLPTGAYRARVKLKRGQFKIEILASQG